LVNAEYADINRDAVILKNKDYFFLNERLPKVARVLGSIPASSDTVESEGRQMKQLNKVLEKSKNSTHTNLV
jgi:hypothetical protein